MSRVNLKFRTSLSYHTTLKNSIFPSEKSQNNIFDELDVSATTEGI